MVQDNTEEVLNVERSGWMAQRGAEERLAWVCSRWQSPGGHMPPYGAISSPSPPTEFKKTSLCFPPQWPPLPHKASDLMAQEHRDRGERRWGKEFAESVGKVRGKEVKQ